MEEACDPFLQARQVPRLAQRNGMVEQRALDAGRQVVPLHDQSCAEAPQDMLLGLGENDTLVAIFL